jgi:AcrR family transcriptional regulator
MGETTEPSKQKERTTRERLLEAAIEMFAERGYAASGVDALCRRAGVAKTGLYWEFQSKAGLLEAVVDRVIGEWMQEVMTAGAEMTDPRRRLDLVLAAVRRTIGDRPQLFRVILVVLAERTQVDQEARNVLRRFFERTRDALSQLILASTLTKLAEKDVRTTSDLILAMLEGLFLRMQVYGADDREFESIFDGTRKSILLMIRESVANAHGKTTLAGPVLDIAIPIPTT